MSTVQRLLLVLLLIVCSSQAALAGYGTATLGEDPRPYAVILSSNTRKGIGDDWVSDQFGFAYMQNVQKGSPQTDYCYTNPRAGSSATLIAIDGVASPENHEAIERDVGGDGPNSVIFEGRTQDCYYLVTGYSSGLYSGVGLGEPLFWYSEFDTNQNAASPHFVLTLNVRYLSADDFFWTDSISTLRVELQNAKDIADPEVVFKLSQQSLESEWAADTEGTVTFLEDDGITPANPDKEYTVQRDSQTEIKVRAKVHGMASIMANQVVQSGEPVVRQATTNGLVYPSVAVVDATPSDDAKRFWDWTTDNTPKGTRWGSSGKKIWSIVADRPAVTKNTCLDFGAKATMLYIAGHGLKKRAAISGSSNDDASHPLGIYQDDTTVSEMFRPEDIAGTSWAVDGGSIWIILAVCSQVRVGDDEPWANPVAATDNGVKWIQAMPRAHQLLGYRASAPGNGTDTIIAGEFVTLMEKGLTISRAWLRANEKHKAWNASALVFSKTDDDLAWSTNKRFPKAHDRTAAVFYYYRDMGWPLPDYKLKVKPIAVLP